MIGLCEEWCLLGCYAVKTSNLRLDYVLNSCQRNAFLGYACIPTEELDVVSQEIVLGVEDT
jgi:hypothetical protein